MRWLRWSLLGRYSDLGVLVLRVGLGLMMMFHGWPKVQGGPSKWAGLGGSMSLFGIDAFPTFWGAAAAFTELVGGALLVLGLGTRPAAALLAFVMFVAAANHYAEEGLRAASHPIETGLGLIALLFLGTGRYGLEDRLRRAGWRAGP